MQSKRVSSSRSSASSLDADAVDVHVLAADQRGDAAAARSSSSSTTSTVRTRWPPSCDVSRSAVGERLRAGVVREEAGGAVRRAGRGGAPRRRARAPGRWRVRGSRLRRPSVSGSSPSPRPSRITSGRCSCASASAVAGRMRDEALEAAPRGRRRARAVARSTSVSAISTTRSPWATCSRSSPSASGSRLGGRRRERRPRTPARGSSVGGLGLRRQRRPAAAA